MGTKSEIDQPVVLVVDDQELLRLNAAGILEDNGFSVVEAVNSTEALKVMESRPDVRLLFTDIQMPGGVNGLELARLVHERWPHVLLIVTSGGYRPDPPEIADHGSFVAKPYCDRELMTEVEEQMSRPSR